VSAVAASLGRIESIHIAPNRGEPMRGLTHVRAIAGVGLEGDRYALGIGTYSATPGRGRQVTLFEAEVLEVLLAAGFMLAPGEVRRNVMTRGVRLNDLVGRDFHLGDVPCRGMLLCEPCSYLEGLVAQPVLRPLVHRGGLRAEILDDGEIAVGDLLSIDD